MKKQFEKLNEEIKNFQPNIPYVVKLILILLFLPAVAIWYVWTRTAWPDKKKWIATIVIVLITLICFSDDSDHRARENRKETEALKARVSQLEKQLDQQKQTQAVEERENAQAQMAETSSDQTKIDEKFYDVAAITDGDTIKVNIDGKIETLRLIGMDTPETVDPRKPVQCFGKESSDKAREILSNKKVRLEADATQGERDQYGRLLRYVFLEDGILFNQKMIEDGYAHEYTFQSNPYKYQTQFQDAERFARENKRGLWAPETCNGDTEKAAVSINEKIVSTDSSSSVATGSIQSNVSVSSTTSIVSTGGVVKKSSTGICHAPGTTYYEKTKSYTAFNSIEECLSSGGRLPRR